MAEMLYSRQVTVPGSAIRGPGKGRPTRWNLHFARQWPVATLLGPQLMERPRQVSATARAHVIEEPAHLQSRIDEPVRDLAA